MGVNKQLFPKSLVSFLLRAPQQSCRLSIFLSISLACRLANRKATIFHTKFILNSTWVHLRTIHELCTLVPFLKVMSCLISGIVCHCSLSLKFNGSLDMRLLLFYWLKVKWNNATYQIFFAAKDESSIYDDKNIIIINISDWCNSIILVINTCFFLPSNTECMRHQKASHSYVLPSKKQYMHFRIQTIYFFFTLKDSQRN